MRLLLPCAPASRSRLSAIKMQIFLPIFRASSTLITSLIHIEALQNAQHKVRNGRLLDKKAAEFSTASKTLVFKTDLFRPNHSTTAENVLTSVRPCPNIVGVSWKNLVLTSGNCQSRNLLSPGRLYGWISLSPSRWYSNTSLVPYLTCRIPSLVAYENGPQPRSRQNTMKHKCIFTCYTLNFLTRPWLWLIWAWISLARSISDFFKSFKIPTRPTRFTFLRYDKPHFLYTLACCVWNRSTRRYATCEVLLNNNFLLTPKMLLQSSALFDYPLIRIAYLLYCNSPW